MTKNRSAQPVAYLTGEYPKVSHTFIQREVHALRRAGIDVQTFSVRRPAAKFIPSDQTEEERSTFYVIEACRNVLRASLDLFALTVRNPKAFLITLRVALQLRQPGLKSLFYQIIYFIEAAILARELMRRQIKHIHNHFGDSSCTVAMLASMLSGIQFSFTEHGPNVFFEAPRWHLDAKIARASFVVAISQFCRSQLMLFSDPQHWSKIAIVHCGVQPDDYRQTPIQDASNSLIYVGRVEPVKGLLVLLEAMAQLKPIHRDLRLMVVGDGSSRAFVEEKAGKLGLAEHTTFVGFKTQKEVADLVSQADVLILPSFAEGVPVVLMEGMASQKPVVATRVAGVQELVEDGIHGFTVPPGDALALADRINRLIEDPPLARRMGKAGRLKVEEQFNIDREAERLATLFRDGASELAGGTENHGYMPSRIDRR